ncbi:MAG TPA: putative toxin-antitoxin system toxin component, PIN family [Clostridia bacterium]|nr:putative toxin-antitoxin system toxin component, PIN family [Clostridia bacterium]HPQ46469.1 putative toxin-antitoxin system toxin component, PIN family [Clostridia bacterium]HRX42959.1 putative toxin-antitoxin system toxin component, PIN family [Clostridia bacterium]
MIDTNVLISAFVFRSGQMDLLIQRITENHKLVISSFVLDELTEVVKRKFRNKQEALDEFLAALPYELVYTPVNMEESLFIIRDKKDYPVLYSAIIEDVDIFITGDRDFENLDIESPQIMTASGFLEKY